MTAATGGSATNARASGGRGLPRPAGAAPIALRTSDLHACYERDRPVLSGIDLTIEVGETVALIGRNGCGKTTLLHCLSGALRPHRGTVELGPGDPVPLSGLASRRRARRLAVLHQSLPPVPGLTVRALVDQGRFAHRHPLARFGDADDAGFVDRALADVDLLDRAGDLLDSLSGGQRQRARLAVVLAQNAPILLLDEPTAHLDIRHQFLLLDLIGRLQAERGLTIVTVLHDLEQASRVARRVVVLERGRIVADGPARAVMTVELMRSVFGVRARVLADGPDTGRILIDGPA